MEIGALTIQNYSSLGPKTHTESPTHASLSAYSYISRIGLNQDSKPTQNKLTLHQMAGFLVLWSQPCVGLATYLTILMTYLAKKKLWSLIHQIWLPIIPLV